MYTIPAVPKEAKNSIVDPLSKDEYFEAVQRIAVRGVMETNKLTVQNIKSNIGLQKQIESLEARVDELELYHQQFKNLDDILKLKMHCTSCCIHLSTAPNQENRICTHPLLLVTQCSTCNDFYTSGEFERGEDGSELYCRWCGQGGEVYCCAECIFVFCKACIKRNFPKDCIRDVMKNENWKCFACVPEYTTGLRARHWALLKYVERQKNEISKKQLNTLQGMDTTMCCRRKRSVSEKSIIPEKSIVPEKLIVPKKLIVPERSITSERSSASDKIITTIKKEKIQDTNSSVHIEDNLHVEPVGIDDNLIRTIPPVPFIRPPVTPQSAVPLQPIAVQRSVNNVSSSVIHQPSNIQPRIPTPVWFTPPTQSQTYVTNNGQPTYRMSFYPQNVMPPNRLPHSTQHMNELAQLNQSTRNNTQVRLPNGHILDLNRLIARQNTPRGPPPIQNNTMLQNMLAARHPPPPPPLISGNSSCEIAPPVPIPMHPPEPDIDLSTAMGRTRLDLHLNNAMEVCQHITHKMRKFPSSQAYQQSRSTADIIQLNLHLAYLLDYTVERFQSIQKKCVEDTKILAKSLKASKDEVEIIEPESHVIDVDADDEAPLYKQNSLTIKRQLESPLTIGIQNKRVPPPQGSTLEAVDDIYANNFFHLNQTSI